MDLSTYLISKLGRLNDTLNYVSDDLVIVITDAMLEMGLDDESEVSSGLLDQAKNMLKIFISKMYG